MKIKNKHICFVKSLLFSFIVIFIKSNLLSQSTCITGAMSIMSTCGSGCICYCDLSEYSWFGQMCNGTSNTGACSAQNLSTSFTLPSGCTCTISARFSNRCNGSGCANCGTNCNNTTCGSSGCGASGMDSGDQLQVGGNSTSPVYTNSTSVGGSPSTATTTNASGYTLTATGSGNSGIILDYTQTGGTMFINLRANRNDEIVTFTLTVSSGCDCNQVLPVDIFSFFVTPKKGLIELQWITKNEKHLSHYKIDKSTDGITFYPLTIIPSENVVYEKTYTAYDDNPTIGLSYYKLTPVNIGGNDENSIIRDAVYQLDYQPFNYSVQNDELTLTFSDFEIPTSFTITNLNGQIIYQIPEINNNIYVVNTSSISKGVYIGVLKNRYQTHVYKIIIL